MKFVSVDVPQGVMFCLANGLNYFLNQLDSRDCCLLHDSSPLDAFQTINFAFENKPSLPLDRNDEIKTKKLHIKRLSSVQIILINLFLGFCGLGFLIF